MDLIDKATQGKHGGDRKSGAVKSDIVTLESSDRGNERQYAFRKLRKDRPDLHQRVLAKEISANAHNILGEAGIVTILPGVSCPGLPLGVQSMRDARAGTSGERNRPLSFAG